MPIVNEKTTSYITISFRDKNGQLALPAAITYRLDCLSNGTVVLTDTVVAPATIIEVTMTPNQNAIINNTNSKENKRLTVTASYGASDSITSQYDYEVLNLSGII